MRTVIRKECTYDEYAEMIDFLDITRPYGVFETRYNSRLKIAVIGFWDSDYIPPAWEEYVVRPATLNSDTRGVSEEYE